VFGAVADGAARTRARQLLVVDSAMQNISNMVDNQVNSHCKWNTKTKQSKTSSKLLPLNTRQISKSFPNTACSILNVQSKQRLN
jgi:hypothetical protein